MTECMYCEKDADGWCCATCREYVCEECWKEDPDRHLTHHCEDKINEDR